MKVKKGNRIQGWDISLGHGGMVELTEGRVSNHWPLSDKKIPQKVEKKLSCCEKVLRVPQAPKEKDQAAFSALRLDWWYDFFEAHVKSTRPNYVAIEDYAYGASQRAHQIGEVGGAARRVLWRYRIPFRLHDPLSIKMFATGNGGADKAEMKRGVQKRWGVEFESSYPAPCFGELVEDLSDATAIAQLLHLELQLRFGIIRLQDLNVKDIQIFNRTTKTYPVNILGRDFIVNRTKNEDPELSES